MKRLFIIIALVILIMLASCSSDSEAVDPKVNKVEGGLSIYCPSNYVISIERSNGLILAEIQGGSMFISYEALGSNYFIEVKKDIPRRNNGR